MSSFISYPLMKCHRQSQCTIIVIILIMNGFVQASACDFVDSKGRPLCDQEFTSGKSTVQPVSSVSAVSPTIINDVSSTYRSLFSLILYFVIQLLASIFASTIFVDFNVVHYKYCRRLPRCLFVAFAPFILVGIAYSQGFSIMLRMCRELKSKRADHQNVPLVPEEQHLAVETDRSVIIFIDNHEVSVNQSFIETFSQLSAKTTALKSYCGTMREYQKFNVWLPVENSTIVEDPQPSTVETSHPSVHFGLELDSRVGCFQLSVQHSSVPGSHHSCHDCDSLTHTNSNVAHIRNASGSKQQGNCLQEELWVNLRKQEGHAIPQHGGSFADLAPEEVSRTSGKRNMRRDTM